MKDKIFHLEDLELLVPAYRDEATGKHLHDYPIFTTEPMYSGSGRPCVNAWQEACGHVKPNDGITVKSMDCGCCAYYKTERPRDLIGVCMCERNRIVQTSKEETT